MEQAEHDLASARLQLEGGFWEWACFASHQAAEKAIKAVYQKLGGEGWGRGLVDLLQGLRERLAVAAEFVSALSRDRLRPAIPALALTTDTSILTAVANDFGFEGVFARQVEALGRPGDVLVGISTSGNSPDVLRAIEVARERGLRTIALTGADGGALAPLADVAIRVPSSETSHIQECHIAIGQLLAFLAEDALYPR